MQEVRPSEIVLCSQCGSQQSGEPETQAWIIRSVGCLVLFDTRKGTATRGRREPCGAVVKDIFPQSGLICPVQCFAVRLPLAPPWVWGTLGDAVAFTAILASYGLRFKMDDCKYQAFMKHLLCCRSRFKKR